MSGEELAKVDPAKVDSVDAVIEKVLEKDAQIALPVAKPRNRIGRPKGEHGECDFTMQAGPRKGEVCGKATMITKDKTKCYQHQTTIEKVATQCTSKKNIYVVSGFKTPDGKTLYLKELAQCTKLTTAEHGRCANHAGSKTEDLDYPEY